MNVLFAEINGQRIAFGFDVVISESHESRSTASRHPVESRADVTDHVQMEPGHVELHGLVTRYPIGYRLDEARQEGRAELAAGQGADEAPIYVPAADIDAWRELKDYQERALAFEVVTSLAVYRNMIITSLSAPRDVRTTSSLDVRISLDEVQTVELIRVQIDPRLLEARKPVDRGRQETKEPVPEVKEQALESILRGLRESRR